MRLPLLIVATAAVSFAGPITFSYSGIGSGTLGGTAFSNAAFTISALADTTNILAFGTGFSLIDTSASIMITGFGTFAFTSPTRNFVNDSSHIAGFSFSTGGTSGTDLLDTTSNIALSTWAMLTSVGPVTGTGTLMQWFTVNARTKSGTLIFNNATPTITFQAIVPTPEPEGSILMLSGFAGGGLLLFLKRRH
ncbi:MAG: hypothetical protein M3N54_02905 [Acidobacteriota bacterium]|nr:hypothetical protein [Acidobacteriota bacterium]